MSNGVILVTGSGGLVGSETALFFLDKGYEVVGIDNDMRKQFFGAEGSTKWMVDNKLKLYDNYHHHNLDIRDFEDLAKLFNKYQTSIVLVVHCAAQPSHDWAAKSPLTDFSVNALGTLHVLECVRSFCPESVFIFTSTNKVYGDFPNTLHYHEDITRYSPSQDNLKYGFDESTTIDNSKHSIFGASKVAADIMVQEYGKYFGMKTACFRGGCLTGPNHSGVELHGFLAYLVKCIVHKRPYKIFGYKGKQVRDNIHSSDLIQAFYEFFKAPRSGEVYNMGGGVYSNCSMLEAINIGVKFTGNKLNYTYIEDNRIGDHKWWISDLSKFEHHYPEWSITYSIGDIIQEIVDAEIKK